MWQEVWKIKCIKRKREWCLNLADIIIHQFLVTVKKFYASEKMDLKYADNHWYVNLSLCLKEKLKKIPVEEFQELISEVYEKVNY